MRIGIVGAGALGLYYGAMLQRSGQDVRFLLRSDYRAIRDNGLQVRSVDGDFHLEKVQGFRRPEDIGPVDLVMVGLKTFANHRLVELVRPLLGDRTAILTLQNGLGNEELLAAALGAERVLGGIAFLCANRGEPGTLLHLGQGHIRLGELVGGPSERAEAIAARFRSSGIQCEAVADLRRARWEKLVWNIPFNGLCALTGRDVTDLLAGLPGRQQVRYLMEEVVMAANAQGLSEKIPRDFIDRMIEFTDGMDHYRPSMMIDRLEGRPLELEAIYGIPLKMAAEKGLDMARVGMLYALLAAGEPL